MDRHRKDTCAWFWRVYSQKDPRWHAYGVADCVRCAEAAVARAEHELFDRLGNCPSIMEAIAPAVDCSDQTIYRIARYGLN